MPHAGYVYSGPIAGTAYAALAACSAGIERVVLLGPAHRIYVDGLAASSADAFATPLGDVALDRGALAHVLRRPQVGIADAAHAAEHSLEVQLPFLQRILSHFALLPLAVGDASHGAVAEVLDDLWGGEDTLVLISSDLSHYYDYDTACRLDADTARAIETLRPRRSAPTRRAGAFRSAGCCSPRSATACARSCSTCATRATPPGHVTRWSATARSRSRPEQPIHATQRPSVVGDPRDERTTDFTDHANRLIPPRVMRASVLRNP